MSPTAWATSFLQVSYRLNPVCSHSYHCLTRAQGCVSKTPGLPGATHNTAAALGRKLFIPVQQNDHGQTHTMRCDPAKLKAQAWADTNPPSRLHRRAATRSTPSEAQLCYRDLCEQNVMLDSNIYGTQWLVLCKGQMLQTQPTSSLIANRHKHVHIIKVAPAKRVRESRPPFPGASLLKPFM